MQYVLSENYALRGYASGKQQALLDLNTGKKIHIPQAMSEVLKMCDGKTDFDTFFLFPALKKNAEKAFEKGWVVNAASGAVLRPEQAYRELAAPSIQHIQWSITGRCNAKCRHCFTADSQHQHHDLEYDEMLKVLDELAENDIYQISLTGGEPLLRPDLPLLLKEMASRKIKVAAVSTNGFLLTEKMLNLFAENGMQPFFQISFDGVGHHDWMRSIEGAEKLATAAMDVCRKNGVSFDLAMCLHKGNLHLVPETVRFAEDQGARTIRLSTVLNFDGFSEEKGVKLLPLADAFSFYLTYLPEFIKSGPDIFLDLCGFISIHGKHPEDYKSQLNHIGCINLQTNQFRIADENHVYLSDEGRLLPCMAFVGSRIEKDFYNLASHSLYECIAAPAYQNMLNLCADELFRNNPQCKDCKYILSCAGGGCRGVSFAKSDSLYTADEDVCSVFRDRWFEKLIEVIDSCLQ